MASETQGEARPSIAPGQNRIIWGVALAQLVAIGVLWHSFSLFLKPLNQEFGWTSSQITTAFTLSLFVSDMFGIPFGYVMDRRGGRFLMTAGALIGAAGLFAITRVQTLTEFYLSCFGLGLAQSMLLGNIPAAVITANVTDFRRGLTYTAIIVGFASMVGPPIVGGVMEYYGWRAGLLTGGAMLVFGPGLICLFALRGTVGSRTAEFDRRKTALLEGRLPSAAQGGTSPLRSALRTRAFWALTIAFSVHWYVMSGLVVHLVPLLNERGISPGFALIIYSLTGPAAVLGRIALHVVDPGSGSRRTGRFAYPALGFGMLLLIFAATWGVTGHFAFALVHGAAGGVIMIVRQTVVAEIFGLRGYAAISGAMTTVSILPRTMAPVTLSLLHDWWGGYQGVLWVLFALIVVGTAAFFVGTSERVGAD